MATPRTPLPPDLIGHSIVVGGERVYCRATVRTWHETGLVFLTRTDRTSTRWVVCHWTGSENAPAAVVRNMTAGRKSVHFIVDQAGTVYQCTDANARCGHAAEGNGNSFGVGIEFVSRGHARDVPTRGIVRDERIDVVHGRRVRYAAMTAPQVAAALDLVEALCNAYRLPMRVPLTGNGGVSGDPLDPAALIAFRGVVGHLHLDNEKVDPGLDLLRRIHVRGASLRIG